MRPFGDLKKQVNSRDGLNWAGTLWVGLQLKSMNGCKKNPLTDLVPFRPSMNKPDIVSILEILRQEGIEFKEKGKSFWTLCPLHSEKTPSFKVDRERQTGHCFGCGFHGDIIAFVQEYKGLSFKDALRYLGINGRSYKPDPREIKKRELVKAFKAWCYEKHDLLCTLYRKLQEVKSLVKNEDDLGSLAKFYHLESLWLYQIEILLSNSDEKKFNLYKEIIYGS